MAEVKLHRRTVATLALLLLAVYGAVLPAGAQEGTVPNAERSLPNDLSVAVVEKIAEGKGKKGTFGSITISIEDVVVMENKQVQLKMSVAEANHGGDWELDSAQQLREFWGEEVDDPVDDLAFDGKLSVLSHQRHG